jgi:peptidoglycan hydrolase-like protein with peptidoglycan-binding domain
MSINFDQAPGYIRSEIAPPNGAIVKGEKGIWAKRVQEWLNYHDCRISIDSDYGPATTAGVKDFQTKIDLPATGAVDVATWEALIKPMRMALQTPENINSMSSNSSPPVLIVTMTP